MGKLPYPFRPYHPGELLKEELECRHISQKAFALKFGVPYTALNEALNAKRPVSTDLAFLMEAALGVNADLLMRMQTSYNIHVARQDKNLLKFFKQIQKIAAVF